jgi:hypothetical protein
MLYGTQSMGWTDEDKNEGVVGNYVFASEEFQQARQFLLQARLSVAEL